MISHLSLTTTKSLSASVSLQTDANGFEFLIIEHQKLSAAFALHGGHLVHFQLADQAPIIWLSKTAIFNDKKAIRGGVPVCWPWFGAADPALGENLPAHGFARTSKWALGDISESTEGVVVELKLHSSEATLALWPFQFELTLKATLSDTLKLELITENKSATSLTYRSALHTYLNISAPENVSVSGLNEYFYNSLKGKVLETGDTTLLIDQAIDAIYNKANGQILLEDRKLQRTLSITNTGNDSEVLWTPWVEGAQAFADMPDNGYQTMLCIESTITGEHGQQVAAGEKHTLSTYIK
ncbi:D-hexose-6-phosphate mutarotase [Psychromonas sp. Urea-02u-13]|uniref:D-hexose-6-phosphate mutarotase n=1 Tax=Psychromonas sp. Urea-02u-13 TaxID=2058326 RepID=UPI000C33B690|nr:D-hexose-6-phosphate mutarotase [Psychromonas sp. Urea-02u-13]PKG40249.1 D-hexose-6-phosphate mutarotase [Psychromonas sp. Urea-02u-13]